MDFRLDRRSMIMGASGAAASLAIPAWCARARAAPVSPERGLDSYRRMLCGPTGAEVLWWYIGDLHYQTPGKSIVPVARALTVASYTAMKAGARTLTYRFREAGVIIDLATGERLKRNPLTGKPAEVPLVDDPVHDIDWAVQDDGSIIRTAHGMSSTLNLHWTETSANLLLLETTPGPGSFALAPSDAGSDWTGIESTRTVYARRADLARPGFVPGTMIYNATLKLSPSWLATDTPGDHWLVVRGIGQKSRAGEIVNPDTLALVRRYFPKFL